MIGGKTRPDRKFPTNTAFRSYLNEWQILQFLFQRENRFPFKRTLGKKFLNGRDETTLRLGDLYTVDGPNKDHGPPFPLVLFVFRVRRTTVLIITEKETESSKYRRRS